MNLFVQNTVIEGKYLSSENVEINDVAWGYSDYINVSDMDYYIASGFTNLGSSPATCFYNADKVFLSGIKSELANSKESKRKMLQIPDGAVYMRFSFLLADAKTLKIEKGIKSTSYSPSPDDVAHNIKTVEEQTKDMFSWLVESGSSETNLKITNGLIEAITGKFVVRSPDKGSVVIENGAINAESITTDMLSANSITAEKIMADALKSKNYVTGESGSFLNLADGSFDSKYLKWDNTGKVIANDITVVGGSINVNDKFIVNNDGVATLQGATVVGNITAESGKIGKFDLDNLALVTGDTDVTCAGLGGSSQAFWAGSLSMDDAPFRVGYDGKLYASDADISGIINSTDGSIGGWKISSGSFSSGKTYQGETYDIYLNSSGKIIASNENKYNNNKIIFGIFPEIYGRSVYDAGIQILNKEGTNSLLMHDQIVFSRMDDMSDPFQKTAQMTKYDYEGIKFGWAWNVKNGNDWSETTIKSQIYWNEDDSTINFNGADISLNDGKWLYLQKGCIVLKNNAYIYTTTKENNRISLIGYSGSNTLWVGDYSNFTGGNCIITANNVYKNASGSWTSLSDARYKHDFKEISHATDFILGLNPCLYKFNDGTSDRYHMGFKAQEVEKNMLSTIGDTGLTVKYNCTEGLDVDLNNPETYMLGLRYDELIAPLIQVVQEQQYKIQELEKKVTALSN